MLHDAVRIPTRMLSAPSSSPRGVPAVEPRRWRWLPAGLLVTDESWRARHVVVQAALWLSVPALLITGWLGPTPILEGLLLSAAVAVLGVLGLVVPRRQVRAELTSLGIILASFGGVELSGGQVHAHLYILTAIALVALYQRWLPLLYTLGAVIVHHAVLGLVAPERVFATGDPFGVAAQMTGHAGHGTLDMPDMSVASVALMVVVHAAAVLVEVVAILLFWHFSEQLSNRLARSLVELRDREEQLRHQATHDALTGLPNRSHFAEQVIDQLTSGAQFAVLMLDLDDFKLINDTHGHHAGDGVLREAAGRIQGSIAQRDVAARLGGDEFAVLSAVHSGRLMSRRSRTSSWSGSLNPSSSTAVNTAFYGSALASPTPRTPSPCNS